jgi:hypothetical protein
MNGISRCNILNSEASVLPYDSFGRSTCGLGKNTLRAKKEYQNLSGITCYPRLFYIYTVATTGSTGNHVG